MLPFLYFNLISTHLQSAELTSLIIFKQERGILTEMYLPSETIGVYCEWPDDQVKTSFNSIIFANILLSRPADREPEISRKTNLELN